MRRSGCRAPRPASSGERRERRCLTLAGFSLIELMIALSLVGLIGLWLVRFVGAQQRAYGRQAVVVQATDNARAAADLWAAEVRNAGFDPRGTAGAGVTHAFPDTVGWTADLNADGDAADFDAVGDERVVYYYDASLRRLMRRSDGTDGIVVEDVDSLAFRYFDREGAPTADPNRIASLEMRVRFTALDGEFQATLPVAATLRNLGR